MEVSMANITMSDYLEGKATAEEVRQAFWDDINSSIEEYIKSRKDHHLEIEISIAWDDEDEYEHEGYYHTIDDAIEALISLKKMEKEYQEGNQ
jgi:hypothetical protein